MADAGLIVDASSGILLGALGAFVLVRRPFSRASLAFGVFSLTMGTGILVSNGAVMLDSGLGFALATPINHVSALALLALVATFPRPLTRHERWLLPLPLLVLTVLFLPYFEIAEFRGPGMIRRIYMTSAVVYYASAWAALTLLPLRFVSSPRKGGAQRRQIALFAAALVLWPGLHAGSVAFAMGFSPFLRLSQLASAGLVAALWLRGTWHHPTEGRLARRLAWITLAVPLAGMTLTSLAGGYAAVGDAGYMGAARTLGVVFLAYAILRHQLFDIDLKVKWGISRGGLVAILAGIFFIAKEGLEGMLPLDGLVPGILGAALVSLVAFPAWRLANRVADRLLPGVQDTEEYRLVRKRDIYAAALEGALVDGTVSSRERNMLLRLQQQLGLSASEAGDLERTLTA